MRFGLAARFAVGGALVVVFLVVELFVVLHSLDAVRSATRHEERANTAAALAEKTEKLVLDLEAGTRGYVITQDPSFLRSWQAARAALPATSKQLMAMTPRPQTAAIDAAWRRYLRTWSLPTVAIARVNPAAARAQLASTRGERLVVGIRRLIDPYVTAQQAAADRARERASHEEHVAFMSGLGGTVVRILLILAIIGYFLRAVVAPVRRIAVATGLVAEGDLDVRVPEGGAGEIGQLAVALNEMTRSLAQQQRSLEEQNVDLERLANLLRAVLDSTVDGILLTDAEGRVQLANRPIVALTRELGMTFEGTAVDRLLSIADRIAEPEKFRAAMERLRVNPDEPTFDEFEDKVTGRVYQGWTAPVHDDRGGFVGRIWTMRDVSQQRELDRLKDEFVATVSHELRTPLTSMMGFLEMIREGEAGTLTEEQKRFLAIVYRSSERLQRLVGDLLFVARLDANGLQLKFADVHVDEVMRESVESASALARAREIELTSVLDEVPAVSGDRERLAQLFSNLISNALKFTPAGGHVTTRTFAENGRVIVEVEDSGIGIPEAEQERLFERFFRSSTATAQAIPGTGLGLVISKAIAEAHGGLIRVHSSHGQGARFRVELPLEREEVAA